MSSHEHDQHHVTPFSTFLKVYGSLITLTVLTVFTATQVNLGAFNTILAMLIATAKVLIVMFWFMHLKYDTRLNRITISSAFFFLLVFVGFSAMDIFTRKNLQNISIEQLEAKAEHSTVPSEGEPPQEVIKTPEEPGHGPSNGH
jgi:cytochrome c oxidase subunit 4